MSMEYNQGLLGSSSRSEVITSRASNEYFALGNDCLVRRVSASVFEIAIMTGRSMGRDHALVKDCRESSSMWNMFAAVLYEHQNYLPCLTYCDYWNVVRDSLISSN